MTRTEPLFKTAWHRSRRLNAAKLPLIRAAPKIKLPLRIASRVSYFGIALFIAPKRLTMVDWKKYRESIGYTQAKMSKDANAWYNLAIDYNRAAELLQEYGDRIPGDTRPFAFNAALSLEQI